jgi:hypothetical protein
MKVWLQEMKHNHDIFIHSIINLVQQKTKNTIEINFKIKQNIF